MLVLSLLCTIEAYTLTYYMYISDICRTKPMLIGGGQENGIRSGTESTILIAGLGEASRLYSCESKSLLLHMLRLKLRLVEGLIAAFGSPAEGKIRFNGPNKSCVPEELKREIRELHELFPGTECLPARRFVDQLPNTVSVSFRGIYATSLLALLADKVF